MFATFAFSFVKATYNEVKINKKDYFAAMDNDKMLVVFVSGSI